ASVLIVFSDLIIRGRLSLFQFNLEIYTKYFTLPILKYWYYIKDFIKLIWNKYIGCFGDLNCPMAAD
ncbi:hypothetical protein, partial [Limosilactobacillus mucosae]|uniref:hypothetical protein n=1 Tax=Limosilactobacillus mucosae TaxID=97478 RepID=UPI001F56548C